MSIPEKRKSRNIQASIKRWLDENFVTPNSFTSQTNFDDRTFDAANMDEWVDVHFLSNGAGRKGQTLFQIAVNSRVGGRRTDGDRYGDEMNRIADLIHDAMHTREIPVYNYSDKDNPVIIADAQLIVLNSGGTYREPEEDQTFDPDDGIMRRVLTYAVRYIGDISRASEYYD